MKVYSVTGTDTVWATREHAERFMRSGITVDPDPDVHITAPQISELELMGYDASPAQCVADAYAKECETSRASLDIVTSPS